VGWRWWKSACLVADSWLAQYDESGADVLENLWRTLIPRSLLSPLIVVRVDMRLWNDGEMALQQSKKRSVGERKKAEGEEKEGD